MFTITIKQVKQVPAAGSSYERLHNKEEFDSKTEPQYGYIKKEGIEIEEITVYTQQVESLDIVKVIAAVNGEKDTKFKPGDAIPI